MISKAREHELIRTHRAAVTAVLSEPGRDPDDVVMENIKDTFSTEELQYLAGLGVGITAALIHLVAHGDDLDALTCWEFVIKAARDEGLPYGVI